MATTADIRNGLCIELNNDILRVIDFSKFQVGRGSGKVWTKLKSSTTGRVVEHTFNSGHPITEVRVERRKFQYLYPEEGAYALMNQETFDQISIQEDMVDNGKFLKEGDVVDVLYHGQKDTILSVELPQTVILEITYTEPGVKGDTATNTLKQATLETGAVVNVPLFVNTGEIIKIDTRDWSYSGKVK